tara:strand:+ start:1436 stop:2320 length:885 start_codon:yes stop_codon:yes gene_type:complete
MISSKKLSEVLNIDINETIYFDHIGNLSTKNKANVLSWLFDKQYIKELKNNSNITGVITTLEISKLINDYNIKIFISEDPMAHAIKLLNFQFSIAKIPSEIDSTANIHSSAYVSPHNVIIGKNVIIEANSSIHSGSTIGDNCVIRSNVVIGGDNFGHVHNNRGDVITSLEKSHVILEKNVEVGHFSCIDLGDSGQNTIIGANTKIHQKVQICHGNIIGKNCIIWGGVFVCGFCKIGDSVKIQPRVIISNNIKIGSKSYIGINSLVTQDVDDGKTFFAGRQFSSKNILSKLNLKK